MKKNKHKETRDKNKAKIDTRSAVFMDCFFSSTLVLLGKNSTVFALCKENKDSEQGKGKMIFPHNYQVDFLLFRTDDLSNDGIAKSLILWKMAERGRFELPMPLAACRFSRAVLSTTQSPLLISLLEKTEINSTWFLNHCYGFMRRYPRQKQVTYIML